MKDSDLAAKIKSIRAPARGDDYWEEFPERILAELQARPMPHTAREVFMPVVWWCGRAALACLVVTFCLLQTRAPKMVSRALLKDGTAVRHSVTRFEQRVGRVMQDEHGLHWLIEEKP